MFTPLTLFQPIGVFRGLMLTEVLHHLSPSLSSVISLYLQTPGKVFGAAPFGVLPWAQWLFPPGPKACSRCFPLLIFHFKFQTHRNVTRLYNRHPYTFHEVHQLLTFHHISLIFTVHVITVTVKPWFSNVSCLEQVHRKTCLSCQIKLMFSTQQPFPAEACISNGKKWFGFRTNHFLYSLLERVKFENQGSTVLLVSPNHLRVLQT